MDIEPGILLFIVFGLLLCFNTPIAIALGLGGVITIVLSGGSLDIVAFTMYSATAKFTLLAIPFFILAGVVMEQAGVSSRLVRFANVCVGHITGGLAIVLVVTSCFFAAISGSGPATVAALGAILIPAMSEAGYDKSMASALMANAGAIGIIIPPSIAFVVYGVVAEVSIGKLFMAGVIPGLVIGLALAVVSYIISKKRGWGGGGKKPTMRELWDAFKDAAWGLMTPVIILGGIYGGIFTPTEAAGVAAVYGLFVGFFVYKELNLAKLKKLLIDASVGSAVVMLIVASATLFAWLVTTEGVAQDMSKAMVEFSNNKYVILLIMNLILIVAGCFIDAISAYYILLPIFIPILNAVGVDLVLFGVIMTVNLAIGQITPPVGVNLYVACNIANISLKQISRAVMPFLIASLIALAAITYIPAVSLWLPNILGMK
ncbi:TRAP transporter large permease [Anaeroselena agilis]|uniref:TRAP transporter large permease n=1 Tax=Anaeroselena agilis TaxID=3063788 RepID=A0ABU3P0Q0_9FIRM|nr:TRAP transporter large permease [Selenomonadales bacterium 4137-cl]